MMTRSLPQPVDHFSFALPLLLLVVLLIMTGKERYKLVDYARLTPVLVEAMKHQQKIIGDQRKEIDGIKKEFASFKEIIRTL